MQSGAPPRPGQGRVPIWMAARGPPGRGSRAGFGDGLLALKALELLQIYREALAGAGQRSGSRAAMAAERTSSWPTTRRPPPGPE